METSFYRKGALALVEGVYSLVPCKVLRVWAHIQENGLIENSLDVVVTASRPGYCKGEVLTDYPSRHIIPRQCVHTRRGSYGRTKYVTPYQWQPD